jgi:hypothetical protein
VNDDDVLRMVDDGLSGLDTGITVETIMARGDARRRKRWLGSIAVAGALAAGTAVGIPALTATTASRPASPPAGSVQLAAFTLVSSPNGTATLTLAKGRTLDPQALRRALAGAGVPATITVGTFCHNEPEPPGLDAALSAQRQADGSVVLVITPSAIPRGAELTIGYRPLTDPGTKDRVRFGLAWAHKSLTCDRLG